MRGEIEEEMRKRQIQAILIIGETTLADPNLTYAVGGDLTRGGVYFKRVGHEPLLVTSNLDAPTARKLGRVKRIESFSQWSLEELVAKYGRGEAYPRLLAGIAQKNGVQERIALYGRNDLAVGTYLVDRLRKLGVKVSSDESPTLLETVRETKDAEEIRQLRDVGRKTGRVVDTITHVLGSLKRKRGHLTLKGRRATVGLIKTRIGLEIASERLKTPEGTIFAIGASSADPHNPGLSSNEIKEGKLIVFDIFPQGESGYWHDLTRTFIIGRAGSRDRQQFDAVSEAQTACLDLMKPGVIAEEVMSRACDIIERRGYRTIREVFQGKVKNVSSGFNHSLGHGVGLTIGERPYLSLLNKEPLRYRQVVTVEPGVYLPGHGGVRIEDTVLITERRAETLSNVDKQFEIT